MFKNIAKMCFKIILWCLPVMVLLALVLNARNIQNFTFLGWISQLKDVLYNPFIAFKALKAVYNSMDFKVNSILDIFVLLKNYVVLFGWFVKSLFYTTLFVCDNIFNFFNWLTLGYFDENTEEEIQNTLQYLRVFLI